MKKSSMPTQSASLESCQENVRMIDSPFTNQVFAIEVDIGCVPVGAPGLVYRVEHLDGVSQRRKWEIGSLRYTP